MIIGIHGKRGSGKSTGAEGLKTLGYPVAVLKFAAPLYQMQQMIYHTISPVYQPPEGFVKDRTLLQLLGTDWGRNTISPTLWLDLWRARAIQLQGRDPDLIIVADDVRFDNESAAIRSMGGVLVHLTRPAMASPSEGVPNHESEAGISFAEGDYRIVNDGSAEDLKESFRQLFHRIESGEGN